MKRLLVLVLAGCASARGLDSEDHAVLRGFTVEEVREAAHVVVDEIAHPQSVVRATSDGVLTEGRIGVCGRDVACGGSPAYSDMATPWTTIEVRFLDRGQDTAVEVEIEYESTSHCADRGQAITCTPQHLGTTGALERRIIDGIRARLEASNVADASSA